MRISLKQIVIFIIITLLLFADIKQLGKLSYKYFILSLNYAKNFINKNQGKGDSNS